MRAKIQLIILIANIMLGILILESCADLSIDSSDSIIASWSSAVSYSSSIKKSSSSSSVSYSSSIKKSSSSSSVSYSSSTKVSSASASGYFTDARDGQVYRYVTIGSQVWMSENLNYLPVSGNSWCYNNISVNCDDFGRLYDWATSMGISSTYNFNNYSDTIMHKGICPTGWHVPQASEWLVLENYVGGYETAGTYLKSSSGWDIYVGISNLDKYGFTALPGGAIISSDYSSNALGSAGAWWTASGSDSIAYERIMTHSATGVYCGYTENGESYNYYKTNGFSLRCVKN